MGNNGIAQDRINLDHLEFHGFANVLVVITDRLDIDLRSWQKGFDAINFDNETSFGPGFHLALNHQVFFVGFNNALPGIHNAGRFAGKQQMTVAILPVDDQNLHFIPNT